MPQSYTPFLAKAGAAIGRGLEKRGIAEQKEQQNRLAGSAYMGDPQAMEELMQVNPQMGAKIQQEARKRKEDQQQTALDKETRTRKLFTENKEIIDEVVEDVAKFDNYDEAKTYFNRKKEEHRPIFGDALDAVELTEQMYNESKQLHGEGAGGAYAGKGMEAQVSNILVKGVEDPEFRNTPEYARAWQLANEPKIIRTPTGDITLRPELSAVFKPPGPAKPEAQQIKESKEAVKRDVEIIPGTKKEIKTTADEKLSFGYYNRMVKDEKNIGKLGDFDSADIWERFKGVTNITASPELQKYRQAADDWIRAKLRRESGAVIAEEEMDAEYEVYFPQIGDGQAVMDQKKSSRKTAVEAMKVASGKEIKKREKAIKESGLTLEEFEELEQLRQEFGR